MRNDRRCFGKLALVFAGIIIASGYAQGQISTDLEIIVTNAAQQSRTLHCGVNAAATDGVDTELGELSLPPFPPTSAFEARFVSHGSATIGQGSPSDFRPLISAEQSDVYKIRFQPGSNGMPVTVTWDMEYVKGHYTTATLSDPFGGVIVTVDMKATSSLEVTNPALTELVLQLDGPRDPSSGVADGDDAGENIQAEIRFVNGNLRVDYSLSRSALVSIALSDIGGREVGKIQESRATDAGDHTEMFDVTGTPSGIYFVSLETEEGRIIRKAVLAR